MKWQTVLGNKFFFFFSAFLIFLLCPFPTRASRLNNPRRLFTFGLLPDVVPG
ncbi:hypothetical protein CPB83DRAFT_848358 [Crepidotus variabilis]|uniref:Uncharacterized protein n=1 Tax=Crepidotus variabilis TaxID=179855 RepID=A0A9P6ENM6_9AGAR|nr:hypothetical protein CPB83DRAFT_848358 [Crepidotus variabilis]